MQVLRTLVLSFALLTGAAGVAHADRQMGGHMGPGFGGFGHEDQGQSFRDRGPWRGGRGGGRGWGPGRGPGRGDDFGRGPGRGGPGWGGGHGGGNGGGWDDGQDGGWDDGQGFPQGPGRPQQPGFPQGPGRPNNPGYGQLLPIYRSFTGQSHFWSLDPNEGARAGFHFEGVGFQTFANQGYNTAPIFRCFTGATHFISRDAFCEGQRQEGGLGFVAQAPSPQTPNALTRCYNGRSHLITANVQECYNAGYGVEGVLGYVP